MPDISVSSSLAALDASVELATTDTAVASLDVKGSWAGTLNVEATNTGDWADAYAPNVFTVANAAAATTLTANGRRRIDTAAAAKIRARMNPYTSGAAVVNLRAGTGPPPSGGGGGGGAMTVADGADVAQGATADAAVTTNAAGTLSGKLRGLVAILSDVWNASLHFLQVGGVAAVGAPPAGNPVSVSGFDGTNKQHLLTDTTGRQVAVGAAGHGAATAGSPLLQGAVAIAHGTNPTAVAAAQATQIYASRAGIPFVVGGHPNVQTIGVNYAAAQTDTAIVTVAAGLKIVVTGFLVTLGNAATVNVPVRLGFGTVSTPAYGSAQLLGGHPNVAAGSGFGRGGGSGILGAGADNEDLRITSGVPTGDSLSVFVSYYTIES